MADVVTTEMKKQAFETGLIHIMKTWTSLSLAVDQGWGGRESARKRDDLYNQLLSCFYASPSDQILLGRKRINARSIVNSDEALADYLYDQLSIRFHIESEDDEEYLEVARIMRQLAATLKSGDFSFYEQVMRLSADGVKGSVGQQVQTGLGADLEEYSMYGPKNGMNEESGSSDSESEYADQEQIYADALDGKYNE